LSKKILNVLPGVSALHVGRSVLASSVGPIQVLLAHCWQVQGNSSPSEILRHDSQTQNYSDAAADDAN
jgi:hypothetical protein